MTTTIYTMRISGKEIVIQIIVLDATPIALRHSFISSGFDLVTRGWTEKKIPSKKMLAETH